MPLQVNAVTIDGITPLFNACCSGSAACVNMLLEFGARVQLGNHLPSPIHEAVKRGNLQGVRGVSEANNNYVTKASFVVDKASKKTISISVQINRLGFFTALVPHSCIWACSALQQFSDSSFPCTGHRECMETLLAHEVDIDQEDPQHGTPLYMACTYQRTECVKKLLELGTPEKGLGESCGGVSQCSCCL